MGLALDAADFCKQQHWEGGSAGALPWTAGQHPAAKLPSGAGRPGGSSPRSPGEPLLVKYVPAGFAV